ncbi:MAG: transporter substrate-binding domain-containing protein [Actinomycetota bacterium]
MPRELLLSCLCALVALLVAACVPPEPGDEGVVAHDRDTTMGRLQREGEITIALPDDLGPFSSIDDAGEPRGFVAELAAEIVAALGVDATYVPASGETSLDLVKEGEVDLAFPTVGITEQLARQNNLSGPYWVAHKRLLVPQDSPVQTAEDLEGQAVCQYEEEGTRTDIADVFANVRAREVSDFRTCSARLQDGIGAVTSPDVYLMVMAAELEGYEIRGEQLNTSGYGAAMPREAADMRSFVNSVLTEVKSEGRWLAYYEEWLEPVANRADVNAPDLTLEEAATLWPRSPSE